MCIKTLALVYFGIVNFVQKRFIQMDRVEVKNCEIPCVDLKSNSAYLYNKGHNFWKSLNLRIEH